MKHLDEGQLRTLLDGELVDGDAANARQHLAECEPCRELSEELEAGGVLVGAALGRLDTVVAPAEARATVLARVGVGRPATNPDIRPDIRPARPSTLRPGRERFAFARAALFVLFFGGVLATALPASPVRDWLSGGWNRVVAFLAPAAEEPTPSVAAVAERQGPESAGVRLEVVGGELTVVLRDIEAGAEVDVLLVDGFQAGAFAAEPARFRTAAGLIEVNGGSGNVRIDIPRSVEMASIEVNGRIYLTKTGAELVVSGPVITRTPEEIRLSVR